MTQEQVLSPREWIQDALKSVNDCLDRYPDIDLWENVDVKFIGVCNPPTSFNDLKRLIRPPNRRNWIPSIDYMFNEHIIRFMKAIEDGQYVNIYDKIQTSFKGFTYEKILEIAYMLSTFDIIDMSIHNTGVFVRLRYTRFNIDFDIREIY